MKYLIQTSEIYRVDSDVEAKTLIKEAKENSRFELKKYSSEMKQRKVRGEIADEWIQVTLVKMFNDPKEPIEEINISYE